MNYYTVDPTEQERLSARRLFRFVRDYVWPYHPYLRRMYQKAGVDVNRLREPEDIRRLPIIEKKDLESDPLAFVLQPSFEGGAPPRNGYETRSLRKTTLLKYAFQAAMNVPPDYSQLVRRPTFRQKLRRRGLLEWQPIHSHFSTGSNGTPTPVFFSSRDLKTSIAEMSALLIQPPNHASDATFDWSERIMNIFPGAPHIAFFSPVMMKILAGFSTFETFGGSVIPTDRQISIFAGGQFSSLMAIPSYLVHWLRRANALVQEGRIGPLSSLRRAVVGAEPVSETFREYIRNLAIDAGANPAFRIHQSFGMTEMKWSFMECDERSGIHLNPKYYFWELLHPETREPVLPGEPGVLVFSHIDWRGTVLIRYWTGDLIKGGMLRTRCPNCGYSYPRVYPPVCRAEKDFTKLKGTRVDLSLLVETVRDTPGVRQFQISLESENGGGQFSRDLLALRLAVENTCDPGEVEGTVRSRVKYYTEVTPDRVEFEDEKTLEQRLFARNGIKAEYLLELRKHRL